MTSNYTPISRNMRILRDIRIAMNVRDASPSLTPGQYTLDMLLEAINASPTLVVALNDLNAAGGKPIEISTRNGYADTNPPGVRVIRGAVYGASPAEMIRLIAHEVAGHHMIRSLIDDIFQGNNEEYNALSPTERLAYLDNICVISESFSHLAERQVGREMPERYRFPDTGKLDEEARMASAIADVLSSNPILLENDKEALLAGARLLNSTLRNTYYTAQCVGWGARRTARGSAEIHRAGTEISEDGDETVFSLEGVTVTMSSRVNADGTTTHTSTVTSIATGQPLSSTARVVNSAGIQISDTVTSFGTSGEKWGQVFHNHIG